MKVAWILMNLLPLIIGMNGEHARNADSENLQSKWDQYNRKRDASSYYIQNSDISEVENDANNILDFRVQKRFPLESSNVDLVQKTMDYQREKRAIASDASIVFRDITTTVLDARRINDVSTSNRKARKSEDEPEIDDIIQGIMNLLGGGNVKVDSASISRRVPNSMAHRPTTRTRVNDRGPPRIGLNPFNFFRPSRTTVNRIPVEASVPHAGAPVFGRPSFIANTLPPFAATLPPMLEVPAPYDIPPQKFNINPVSSTNSVVSDDGIGATPPLISTTDSNPHKASSTDENNNENLLNSSTIKSITDLPTLSEETFQTNSFDLTSESIKLPAATSSNTVNKKRITNVWVSEGDTMSPVSLQSSDVTETQFSTIPKTFLTMKPTKSISEVETKETIEITSTFSTNFSTKPLYSIYDNVKYSEEKIKTSVPRTVIDQKTSSEYSTKSIHVTNTVISSTKKTQIKPSKTVTSPVRTISRQSVHDTSSKTRQQTITTKPPYSLTKESSGKDDIKPSKTIAKKPSPVLRPGYVVGGNRKGQVVVNNPGEIFDVTVMAHQGFGGQVRPVVARPSFAVADKDLVLGPGKNDGEYVSIDGRKTYFDLFGQGATKAPQVQATKVADSRPKGNGVGVVVPEGAVGPPYSVVQKKKQAPKVDVKIVNTPFRRKPSRPPVRIDTCIVGDSSTCQAKLGEVCRREGGVSSCHCRPATDRKRPRTMCKDMVMLEVSLKVDRLGKRRISWDQRYEDPESHEYQQMHWEASNAVDDLLRKSGLKSVYFGSDVNKFYSLNGRLMINSTVRLEDSPHTRTSGIKKQLQRHLIRVIQSHGNNLGESKLAVEGPMNPIPRVLDVDECSLAVLHDCHTSAACVNTFASYTCQCLPGYTDKDAEEPRKAGRKCESCSNELCHQRGECTIRDGHNYCVCRGSYYGSRCEVDGEVVAVAVGASVAAVVIIVVTLLFLCMWSRRWKHQEQRTEALRRGFFFPGAFMNPNKGIPPHQYAEYPTMMHQQQTLYKPHQPMPEYPGSQYGGHLMANPYLGGHQSMPIYGPYPPHPAMSQSGLPPRAGAMSPPPDTTTDDDSPGAFYGVHPNQSGPYQPPYGGPSSQGAPGGYPSAAYGVPRPKSRASVGDSEEVYYELEDLQPPGFDPFEGPPPRRPSQLAPKPPPPLPRHIFNH